MAKAAAKTSTSAKIVKSSKVDLASNTKTKVVGLLNERLADGIEISSAELKDGLPACEQGGDTGSPSSNAFNVRAMRGDRDRARRSPAGNPARR